MLQDCPAGKYCPKPDESPIPCQNGFYTDALKQTRCSICPEGYQCHSASDKPTPCHAGHFSQAGNSTCSLCPAGYECPNGEYTIFIHKMISNDHPKRHCLP